MFSNHRSWGAFLPLGWGGRGGFQTFIKFNPAGIVITRFFLEIFRRIFSFGRIYQRKNLPYRQDRIYTVYIICQVQGHLILYSLPTLSAPPHYPAAKRLELLYNFSRQCVYVVGRPTFPCTARVEETEGLSRPFDRVFYYVRANSFVSRSKFQKFVE